MAAKRLDLTTKFPGWTAEVYGAEQDEPDDIDGWTNVAPATKVGEDTADQARHRRRRYRHYLVWITQLPQGGKAAIQELSLYR